jgi:hypothetical protein
LDNNNTIQTVKVNIRNNINTEYITTSYIRIVMAPILVVVVTSSFSKNAALASFANKIIVHGGYGGICNITNIVSNIHEMLNEHNNEEKNSSSSLSFFLSSYQIQTMWKDTTNPKNNPVIQWLTS